MKKYYWLIALCMPLLLPSCSMYDTLFGEFVIQKTPDTLVLAIEQERTELQYLENDSIYRISRYWVDGLGTRLYKSLEEHYKRGRRHGTMRMWSKEGNLIHESYWDEGVKVDSFRTWFDNGQLKQYILYSQVGNPIQECNFHANGRRRTDTLLYREGKLTGEVNHFDSLGKRTETYLYRNDTLLNVQIFKSIYESMDNRARLLAAQKVRDSLDKVSGKFKANELANPDEVPEYMRDTSKGGNTKTKTKYFGLDEVW